jgi:hypothetical protein
MPRVANYTVVADSWTAGPRIDFDVGAVDPDSRCVLTFMLDPDTGAEAGVEIRINGTSVWHWTFPEDPARPARSFQEVLPSGLITPGKNRLELVPTPATTGLVLISDIVLWWQMSL